MPYEQKEHRNKINQIFNERKVVLPLSLKNNHTLTNSFHVHISFVSSMFFLWAVDYQ